MHPRSKILAKALKLQELSIRGIDGEKDTATRMFAKYKSDNTITDTELCQAAQQGTEANTLYEQYQTDTGILKEFLTEFFGPLGGTLVWGFLKIVTTEMNHSMKYKDESI